MDFQVWQVARGTPPAHEMLDQRKQDVCVQAALVSFIQDNHRILVQLLVIQALPQQRPICKRSQALEEESG